MIYLHHLLPQFTKSDIIFSVLLFMLSIRFLKSIE